ncbi:hypothetical protein LTR28_007000 [Elasticomyces elasticus]|nr:hypothetical protein LTR28_007000 [Elasticomyces elasticus]
MQRIKAGRGLVLDALDEDEEEQERAHLILRFRAYSSHNRTTTTTTTNMYGMGDIEKVVKAEAAKAAAENEKVIRDAEEDEEEKLGEMDRNYKEGDDDAKEEDDKDEEDA